MELNLKSVDSLTDESTMSLVMALGQNMQDAKRDQKSDFRSPLVLSATDQYGSPIRPFDLQSETKNFQFTF